MGDIIISSPEWGFKILPEDLPAKLKFNIIQCSNYDGTRNGDLLSFTVYTAHAEVHIHFTAGKSMVFLSVLADEKVNAQFLYRVDTSGHRDAVDTCTKLHGLLRKHGFPEVIPYLDVHVPEVSLVSEYEKFCPHTSVIGPIDIKENS